mgnify:CR=1 FL=1|jgi:mannose-6-phosphate isomerase-like protein (cupin superfamily)|tara:strand:- start:2117 stop:2572 length:456 start_codon:yes stop_codon:yes gene_type:complete
MKGTEQENPFGYDSEQDDAPPPMMITGGPSLPSITKRKWGTYEILLETPTYVVKELIIEPRQSISRQRHYYRSEQWIVLEGTGKIVLENMDFTWHNKVQPASRIKIDPMVWHWIKNTDHEKPLHILETWFGPVLEESDIEREKFDETTVSE